jgi:hypothetical protein
MRPNLIAYLLPVRKIIETGNCQWRRGFDMHTMILAPGTEKRLGKYAQNILESYPCKQLPLEVSA